MTSSKETMASQLEHLQMKYVGTGHADTNRYEWAVNQHRDSYASYVGHTSLMSLFSISENEATGRVRANLLNKMVLPCGVPPKMENNTE